MKSKKERQYDTIKMIWERIKTVEKTYDKVVFENSFARQNELADIIFFLNNKLSELFLEDVSSKEKEIEKIKEEINELREYQKSLIDTRYKVMSFYFETMEVENNIFEQDAEILDKEIQVIYNEFARLRNRIEALEYGDN